MPTLGQGNIIKRTCQIWFQLFRSNNLQFEDCPRSGRPIEVDSEVVRKLVEEVPRQKVTQILVELFILVITDVTIVFRKVNKKATQKIPLNVYVTKRFVIFQKFLHNFGF